MSTNPESAGASVKQMMEQHTAMMDEIQQAQRRIQESTLARQRETVAGAVRGAYSLLPRVHEFARR